MTISGYIKGQFEDFGVRLSEASVLEIAIKCGHGTDADETEVSDSNFREVQRALVKFVPNILLTPTSVQEGGMTISRADRESILAWYRLKCKELGIKDQLTQKPRVTFL